VGSMTCFIIVADELILIEESESGSSVYVFCCLLGICLEVLYHIDSDITSRTWLGNSTV
jgi:hypothetical protein